MTDSFQSISQAAMTAIQETGQGPSFRPANERLRSVPSSLSNLSLDQLLELYLCGQAIECEFGIDPATLPQAAAHEAGHVIVAKAMGETIRGVWLFRQSYAGKLIWLGRNTRTWHGYDGSTKYASENPVLFFRAAINSVAGYCAETVAGLSHQASSLDERYLAALYADAIGDTVGLQAFMVQSAIADFVLSTLDVHKQQFDVVRDHLARTRRITQHQAVRMLGGIKEVCVEGVLQDLIWNTRAMS